VEGENVNTQINRFLISKDVLLFNSVFTSAECFQNFIVAYLISKRYIISW